MVRHLCWLLALGLCCLAFTLDSHPGAADDGLASAPSGLSAATQHTLHGVGPPAHHSPATGRAQERRNIAVALGTLAVGAVLLGGVRLRRRMGGFTRAIRG